MANQNDFPAVFACLKNIFAPFAPALSIKTDEPNNYVLISPKLDDKNKEIYFAALQIKKNYVSFHFMPVYTNPELLEHISPALKKRMQGKSCFNFVKIDDGQLTELADLTAQGFDLYKQKGRTSVLPFY